MFVFVSKICVPLKLFLFIYLWKVNSLTISYMYIVICVHLCDHLAWGQILCLSPHPGSSTHDLKLIRYTMTICFLLAKRDQETWLRRNGSPKARKWRKAWDRMAVLSTEQWSQECPHPDPCHLRLWDHVAHERHFARGLCCWWHDLILDRHDQWKKDLFHSHVHRVHCILTWSQELEQRNIPTVGTLSREELTSWMSKKQMIRPEQEVAEEPQEPAPRDPLPLVRSYLLKLPQSLTVPLSEIHAFNSWTCAGCYICC